MNDKSPLRVLIVEDHPLEAELVQRALYIFSSLLGEPEIIITNTFAAALSIVRGTHPTDIVILDSTLDDSTMQETIKNVRQIEDHSPTFILTGYPKADVEALLAMQDNGHIEVVEKGPHVFTKGFLTGVVSTVISKWHARRKTPMREALQILEGYRRTEA